MANEEEGYALSGLVAAVKQIPVLAIVNIVMSMPLHTSVKRCNIRSKNLIIGVIG